ncbi:MAG: FadR/GntR family transcriptional regulator [Clostridia bacterium]|nr:FadR/GntR family transcriptional regulator [Clostridia bacterium]
MQPGGGIRRVKLSDGIVEHIKSLIMAGRLKPGDKLPPERDFAATLGVSRTALREAVRTLSLMGLLDARQGEGTFVSGLVASSFMKPLSPMLAMGSIDILELVEARRIIESKAVSLCALRASEGELADISALVDEMQLSISYIEHFNQLDLDFHMAVSRGSHNSVLVATLEAIRDALYEQVRGVQSLPGASDRALGYHYQITAALVDRDSERAEREMAEHLNDVERAVVASMVGEG